MASLPAPLRAAAATSSKAVLWLRIIAVAELAVAIKRHLDKLDRDEQRELTRIVRKSKGRPSNLSSREKKDLRRIVEKLEPREFGRAAVSAITGVRPGSKRR